MMRQGTTVEFFKSANGGGLRSQLTISVELRQTISREALRAIAAKQWPKFLTTEPDSTSQFANYLVAELPHLFTTADSKSFDLPVFFRA